MVYVSSDNSLFISCNCGCGISLKFNILDSIMYIDALDSTFSTKQNKIRYRIKEKFELLKNKALKKPIYKHGLILTEEEFKEFIKNLKVMIDRMSEDELEDKYVSEDEEKSAIHVTKMRITDEHILYSISLRLKLSIKDLMLNQHRAYETYFTKAEMLKFVRNMERKFAEK